MVVVVRSLLLVPLLLLRNLCPRHPRNRMRAYIHGHTRLQILQWNILLLLLLLLLLGSIHAECITILARKTGTIIIIIVISSGHFAGR